jgi:hypothetical protein
MVSEVPALETSSWIVSHGKNGSPSTGANQAGNSPQIQCDCRVCADSRDISVRLASDSSPQRLPADRNSSPDGVRLP